MALRNRRRPGLRRAARSGTSLVALAAAVSLAGGALAASPALRQARTHFLAHGEAAGAHHGVTPGDHLQATYNLWLPGHQLSRGAPPWRDPYSFQPVVGERANFAAWPFGLVFWPLHALLGTVGAWNAFVLLTYAGSGAFAALWLRSLGLGAAPSVAGGLVFALAPYRVAQTAAGHLLAPVSMLLPLSLWALETQRAWLAAAALASIPLSGQVHLALGAIPFFVAYVFARRGRTRSGLVVAGVSAAAAIVAGLLVYVLSIRGSVGAGGRSFAQVERYSADALDFVSRSIREGIESFVFLGWLTPLLAIAGAVAVARRDRRLAAVLGAGVVVPIVLALGSNTPLYEPLWRIVPGLRHTRVPERVMPIACLCIAALVAFALARLREPLLVGVAVAALCVDLRVAVFRPAAAGDTAAYAVLRGGGPGRLLELPVFGPDSHLGSVYLYENMATQRERPLGYSTVAPSAAARVAERLEPLNCGRVDTARARLLRALGVRYVTVHTELYDELETPCSPSTAPRLLARLGFERVARDLYVRRDGIDAPGAPLEPAQ